MNERLEHSIQQTRRDDITTKDCIYTLAYIIKYTLFFPNSLEVARNTSAMPRRAYCNRKISVAGVVACVTQSCCHPLATPHLFVRMVSLSRCPLGFPLAD